MFATAMPQGATSLISPAPPKRMGFTIESLVGGGNHHRAVSPPKSEESTSPPLHHNHHHSPPHHNFHHQISPVAAARLLSSTSATSSPSPTTTAATAVSATVALSSSDQSLTPPRFGMNGLPDLPRNILAMREQQELVSDALLREQILLRQRVHHITQEQLLRNSLAQSLDSQNNNNTNGIPSSLAESLNSTSNNSSNRRGRNSPRCSPRGSPRNSPPLNPPTSSPHSFPDEDIITSSSLCRRPQPSSPCSTSPGITSPLLNPLHNSILPHQFMALGGTPPIHIPTPVMQHHILGGGLGGAGLGGGGLPGGLGTPMPPVHREYPLYPWLLTRHGRVFQGGFPSPDYPGFLLPFRKPKRIRTAFSPSQLLKLEQAFEKNQYVVGQERKQLAVALNLSETQVKVWFQNRRTKHKRQQQEGEDGEGGKGDGEKEGLVLEHEEEEEEELDVLEETSQG